MLFWQRIQNFWRTLVEGIRRRKKPRPWNLNINWRKEAIFILYFAGEAEPGGVGWREVGSRATHSPVQPRVKKSSTLWKPSEPKKQKKKPLLLEVPGFLIYFDNASYKCWSGPTCLKVPPYPSPLGPRAPATRHRDTFLFLLRWIFIWAARKYKTAIHGGWPRGEAKQSNPDERKRRKKKTARKYCYINCNYSLIMS